MLEGTNPSPFTTLDPGPRHVPLTTNDELRAQACVYADWAVANRASFTYSEGADRGHMFNSKPGSLPQTADCSQFCTSLLHWAGVKHGLDKHKTPLTDADYTGSLLQKGKAVTAQTARAGDLIIYGPGTGTHAAFVRSRISAMDFWLVSHGHQGDPSRVRHSDLTVWMNRHGHSGVTLLAFLL